MDHILISASFVICLALQVSSQLPPKPIGEWHPDRFEMYPNPYLDSSACKTTKTSGLCDYNEILTPEQREYFIEQPEIKAVGRKRHAPMRIMVTVVIMKKIGPQITDYKAASKDFAEKFRTAWNLPNNAVILIASKNDNMCSLDAGSDVMKLMPANKTEDIDRDINNNSCSKGLIAEGINATLIAYRDALEAEAAEAAAAQTTASTSESEAPKGSPAIIVGVIVGVVVVGIVTASTIIGLKIKKKADEAKTAEGENLKSPPRDVMEGQNEAKAAEVEHLKSTSRDVMEDHNAFV